MSAYLSRMTEIFPPAPSVGTPMLATRPSPDVRRFLSLRRSANKAAIGAPGPDPDQLDKLLAAATRVPDHRRMSPWRFIIFEGEARKAFGEQAADIQAREDAGASEKALQATRGLLMRAPVVVAVVSNTLDDGRTPVWEQELSVGALCHNLLLCANAAGWAGAWLSEWIAYSDGINALLGLSETERVAGYIYLGTATDNPQERARPGAAPISQRWQTPPA